MFKKLFKKNKQDISIEIRKAIDRQGIETIKESEETEMVINRFSDLIEEKSLDGQEYSLDQINEFSPISGYLMKEKLLKHLSERTKLDRGIVKDNILTSELKSGFAGLLFSKRKRTFLYANFLKMRRPSIEGDVSQSKVRVVSNCEIHNHKFHIAFDLYLGSVEIKK